MSSHRKIIEKISIDTKNLAVKERTLSDSDKRRKESFWEREKSTRVILDIRWKKMRPKSLS